MNLVCKTESEKSLEIINYLIKNTKIDINSKDKNGNTPLLMACYFRNNEIILKLLENGADPNKQNIFGNTPLIISYYFKNEKVIQELIKKGADKSIQNKYGNNYLSIAQNNNNNNNRKRSNGRIENESINSSSKAIKTESIINIYNDGK